MVLSMDTEEGAKTMTLGRNLTLTFSGFQMSSLSRNDKME